MLFYIRCALLLQPKVLISVVVLMGVLTKILLKTSSVSEACYLIACANKLIEGAASKHLSLLIFAPEKLSCELLTRFRAQG